MPEVFSARALAGEPQHPATPSTPVNAQWPCSNLTLGAGVAIFHIASARVVLCYHTRRGYWFLPKGRRDVHEHSGPGAEREGYEESGYRNRLLPLPLPHRQPTPHSTADKNSTENLFVTEPVWTMLMPLSGINQYLLFWYVAETLPPDDEAQLNAAQKQQQQQQHPVGESTETERTETETTRPAPKEPEPEKYQYPPPYPAHMTLKARTALEPQGYEPPRHSNTGVDAEEAQYASYLLAIPDALEKLQGTVLADVVRKGWAAIELRGQIEEGSVRVEYSRGKLDVVSLRGEEAVVAA